MRLAGIHKAYGDNVVYAGVDFTVERGERVALVGINGAGKSTLLKMLAGVLPFDAGERVLGAHVEVHYYAQHQLDALDPAHTVLEELEEAAPESAAAPVCGPSSARSSSAATPWTSGWRCCPGGEKARLALAKMLVRPAALLCLDEPTNHLDLASKEVLEEALSAFTGTIVFISHDRYFINRIGTRVVEVQAGRLTDYLGNYDDYLAASAARRRGRSGPPGARRRSLRRAAPSRPPPRPRRSAPRARRPRRPRAARAPRGVDREIRPASLERESRLSGRSERADPRDGGAAGRDRAGPGRSGPLPRRRAGARDRRVAQGTEEQVAWLMKEWEDLSQRLDRGRGG